MRQSRASQAGGAATPHGPFARRVYLRTGEAATPVATYTEIRHVQAGSVSFTPLSDEHWTRIGGTHQTTFAQLSSNEVYVDQQFQVAMDHDGVNTTSYRLYRDHVIVATVSKSAAWVSGVVTFPARAETAPGAYAYHATALNSDGTTTLESARAPRCRWW